VSRASFLERMAESSRERARHAAARESEAALAARARARPAPVPLRLGRFDVIAELKCHSPAAGRLAAADFDPALQLRAYAAGGAAAVSVLTEPTAFGGDLTHLEEAVRVLAPLGCPVMRKDFLTEPYQVLEARAAGASGVLIIVTMLSDTAADALVDLARELGLFVLLEAFDRSDLERLARWADPAAGAAVLAGVNSRNLKSLDVDFARFGELAPWLPAGVPAVAESGITEVGHIEAVASLGYRLALVGSSLMQAPRPELRLADYLAAGRAAAAAPERPCS
jgi:indole-3-glycerol phosphate synthase